jgi:hypothetical protein
MNHRKNSNKNKRRAETPVDDNLRHVRAKKVEVLEPTPAIRRLRDRTSVVPDSTTSSFDVASPAPKHKARQDSALLRVLQDNNISDVKMLEKSAAMLRLLQANGVSDVSMLEELLRKACQPQASSPVCSATIDNTERNPASLDHNASNLAGKELDPKLLNKKWNAISEMLRGAVFEFVGAASVNGNRHAELSTAHDNVDLSGLYQSIFGTDPDERSQHQKDKLCKIYHVLWALLGRIVHIMIRCEDVKIQMLDFVDGIDPRLEILAKSVEQEGM